MHEVSLKKTATLTSCKNQTAFLAKINYFQGWFSTFTVLFLTLSVNTFSV